MRKTTKLKPRGPVLSRFQTPVYGSWVTTAIDAHFDPLAEQPERPHLSREQMEKVPHLLIPDDAGSGH